VISDIFFSAFEIANQLLPQVISPFINLLSNRLNILKKKSNLFIFKLKFILFLIIMVLLYLNNNFIQELLYLFILTNEIIAK